MTQLSGLNKLGTAVDELTSVYSAVFANAPYFEDWNAANVRRSLDRYAKHGCLFVAHLAERIVGFASAGWLGDPLLGGQLPEALLRSLAFDRRERVYIDELGVAPDARRRGVAVALLHALRSAYGMDAGFVLGTHAANQASVALYRSLAFVSSRPRLIQLWRSGLTGASRATIG